LYWKEDKFAAPPLPDTLQSAYYLEFTHLAHMQVFNTSGMEQDHFNQRQVRGYQRTRTLTVPVTPNYISGVFDGASSQPRLRARQRTRFEKVDAILQSLDFQTLGDFLEAFYSTVILVKANLRIHGHPHTKPT
jgi:hypothetical protein